MPETGADRYIYWSREEASAACATKGMQLCTNEQIMGYSLCAFGWLKEDRGYYIHDASQCCCGGSGLNLQNNGGRAGAYCCVGY